MSIFKAIYNAPIRGESMDLLIIEDNNDEVIEIEEDNYYGICFQYPNKNIFKYKVNLPFRWQYKKTKNKTILRCQRINEKIFKEALRKLDYTYKLSDDGIILTLNSLHNEGGLIWK